jgi:MOSC domain-containing protein YiiM
MTTSSDLHHRAAGAAPAPVARLVSLNVGEPALLALPSGGTVSTAIGKTPVSGPLHLGELGLDGDVQADRRNHGGPDKAVCVYPLEHYPHWSEQLGRVLEPGAFGENFSTEGLLESEVCIGDVYRVGSALVQVSQPRSPCFRLAARMGDPRFPSWVQQTGWSGFYLRCLQPGEVGPGDPIALVERPEHGVTIAEANRLIYRDRDDTEATERLIAAMDATAAWGQALRRRLGRS